MRAPGPAALTVARASFAAMYWTLPQLLAHATVNGAPHPPRRPVRLGHGVRAGRRQRGLPAGADRGRDTPALACPTGRPAPSWRTATRWSCGAWAGGDGRPLVSLGEVDRHGPARPTMEV